MLPSSTSPSVSSCAPSRVVANPILRRACDRCHAQKLSCQRDGNGPCARCTKLKTTCTSSPSLRNRRNRPLQRPATRAPAAAPPAENQAHTERSAERPAVGSRPRAPSALSAELADSNPLEGLDEPILDLLGAPSVWQDHHQPQSHDANQVFDQIERIAYQDASPGSFTWDVSTAFTAADLHLPSLLSPTSAPPADNAAAASCALRSLDVMTPLTSPSIDGAPADAFFDPGTRTTTSKLSGRNTDLWSSTSDSAVTQTSVPSAISSHIDVRASSRTTPSPSSARSQEQQRRPSKTDGEWLQKLLEINVQLFNHGNQVMEQSSSAAGDSSSCSDKSASDGPSVTGNSFDQTLLLSLKFIQALRKVHGSSSRDLPAYTTASPAPTLDQGTALIIYSCYIRVLELFTERLNALKGSLDAAMAASTNQEYDAGHSPASTVIPPLDLPTLSACFCPLESFPVLKVRITLELIEEVLDVMSALLLPIIRGPGGSRQRQEEELAMPWRGQMFMPEVSQQSLLAREEAAYQIIRDIRRGFRTSRRAMIS